MTDRDGLLLKSPESQTTTCKEVLACVCWDFVDGGADAYGAGGFELIE